jgi:hypothetical protein
MQPLRGTRALRAPLQFLSKQSLCENRKSCYLGEIAGSNRAPWVAFGGEPKGSENFDLES